MLAAILLSGCWRSPSDKVLDAIIAVNDSLQVTKARLDHRTKLPPVPFIDLGCPEFQTLADSLADAVAHVERAMAPLFADLTGVAQDDHEAGDRSFTKAHQGEALFAAITEVYDIASGIASDDSTRTRIMDIRSSAFPHSSPETWRAADFANVPRAAVVTCLSKVQLDLENLRGMSDNALLKACLEKN
jgi:hypothetical protein